MPAKNRIPGLRLPDVSNFDMLERDMVLRKDRRARQG